MFEILPMSGFEPRISGVGSDRSANCATTTALRVRIVVNVAVLATEIEKKKKEGSVFT